MHVTSLKLIVIFSFFILGCLINFALLTIPRAASYRFEMTPSGVCILLLSFPLGAILLTFSVTTLCVSLLNLIVVISIVLLFFRYSAVLQFYFHFDLTHLYALCFLVNTSIIRHYFSSKFIFHKCNYLFAYLFLYMVSCFFIF